MAQTTGLHNAIIIGGGPSGIALAHTLKHRLGFNDFEVFDKLDGVGGTWRTNSYPGCGCDVPSHLYSFSFNLNPDWSKELCDQEEILQYMESTVDKFDLRQHFRFNVACVGAQWISKENRWEARMKDVKTGVEFTRSATIFVSAVGGISEPRKVAFSGMETFKGEIFHTARWNHNYDYTGKRMAIIGNGCSAAQVLPAVQPKIKQVTQYARSPQWYHERPNRKFSSFEKACFRYVPFMQRWLRLRLFLESDSLVATYGSSPASLKKRSAVEESAKQYIYRMTPEKYHHFIVPAFPLGCKRRIFDPNYLEALNERNVTLIPEGIQKFDETGIVSDNGAHEEFDVVVLATGFQVTNFLTPMEIVGKKGQTLADQWAAGQGAQAYLGTYVHNFPNFAIIFGPNTFPAHNSVIFASEVQVEYIAKTLFTPIIDHRAHAVEVKEEAEEGFVADVEEKLAGSVFSAGCSNWYINTAGRNSASWPGKAANLWKTTLFPRWGDYVYSGGETSWFLRSLVRHIKAAVVSKLGAAGAMAGLVVLMRKNAFLGDGEALSSVMRDIASQVGLLKA